MHELYTQTTSLFHQVAVEFRLFWRRRESVYLSFLVPMLGMALLVYLSQEGTLERFFGLITRGMGGGGASPQSLESVGGMTILTVGLIAYCVITAAFEGMVPDLVRQREAGILKRLGGTPLRGWVFLVAKTLNASALVLIEVSLVFAMGLVSSEVTVVGSWWLLGTILLLGTLTLAALGFILSNLTASVGAAIMAVHAIYIPMLFLCGAIIPVEAMPRALQIVARGLPLTYFVGPFRSVMVEGTGLAANGNDLLILLAWMVGSWIVAVKLFQWE